MARGISVNPCAGDDCCVGMPPGGGSWAEKLIRREKKSPPYIQTLNLGRSSEIVGDVFYGTDDAEGIDECKYKEDVLEVYRREKKRKSIRKMKGGRRMRWIGAIVDCFSFLKLLLCFR